MQRRRALGAYGAPAGPRANLAAADTGATPHKLYVKVVPPGDPDRDSQGITLDVLRYVHDHLPTFAQMGLAVKVHKVRAQDLRDGRLVALLKQRGITQLPALVTPHGVYLGRAAIYNVYDRNLREYAAYGRRGEDAVTGAAPDDLLAGYFGGEMSFERAEEDAETEEMGLGETGDMMDAYRHMMARRENSGASRRPARTPRPPLPADRRAAPPRPAAPTRPDNVAPGRRPPADAEEDEIQATIDRLARDIDDEAVTRAHTSAGGDSLGDGDELDPQDDLMERAYYNRNAETDF
jgi:hypothetical protein